MSELKTTSLTHKDNNTGTPNITMYPDGTTSLPGTMLGGFRNQLINGDFLIWQRGTTGFPLNSSFVADRWRAEFAAEIQQLTTGTPVGFDYALRILNGGVTRWIVQPIEMAPNTTGIFNGTTFTASMWVSTSQANNMEVGLFASDSSLTVVTTTVANYVDFAPVSGVAASNGYTYVSATLNCASDWSPPAGQTCMAVRIQQKAAPGGNTDLTGVQLEPGPVATPFENIPIGTELALCQRYYQVSSRMQCFASNNATISKVLSVPRPVVMRANPTENATASTGTLTLTGSASMYRIEVDNVGQGNAVFIDAYSADAEL